MHRNTLRKRASAPWLISGWTTSICTWCTGQRAGPFRAGLRATSCQSMKPPVRRSIRMWIISIRGRRWNGCSRRVR
uniref:Putative secreted protein n=1 Tax=Anopheles marajoara TaxID=58244 RepID=A0A2M4CD27_9DIPT